MEESTYSQLEALCLLFVDKSAGVACIEARNIVEAIKKAREDIIVAIGVGDFESVCDTIAA